MTAPVLFLVNDGGTLALADFEAPTNRSQFYEHIVDGWSGSPQDLYDAMDQCQPLLWEVNSLYEEYRAQVEDSLEQARSRKDFNQSRIAALAKRLGHLPEEPYDGAGDWLLSLTDVEFEEQVVPIVEKWLDSEPEWINESDYLPASSSAQELALQHFQSMDHKLLSVLGVVIVEGEHPGSTYYAAELQIGTDEANERARQLNVPLRFKRCEK